MDFDEYEYLEKTVEEKDDRDSAKEKKKDAADRTYRKRDVDEDLNVSEDKRSKRSKSDDDNGSKKDREDRGRDRERERSGRDKDRHRSERERDGERSSREKERERDRDKDRERRDKERDRERSSRDREKDKEREKERDRREREKEKEKEKERERSKRSRSRSERDRDRERERDFEPRDGRRFRDKKDAVEPEADPERDQRTVFAYQMPLKASERDVYEFFSKAGKVRDVRLIMDRNSRRSKGVGYIEFYDAMSVPVAIALSGQLLLGQPVMVKPSEAEKNLVQSNASSGAAVVGPYGAVDRKLYVGNLHFNMTESQLREIFEPFGPVEVVQLPLDLETGHCKGFGFIQFAQLEHAKAAQSLNGKLEIAGRTIKVSSVTDHVGGQDTTAKSADLDDDEGGLSLNAQSRALLMQKLADRHGLPGSNGMPVVNGAVPIQPAISLPIGGNAGILPASTLPTQLVPTPMTEPVGIPSECLLLKNMFDPSIETEPDFDMDIKEDVEEECSKYGRVKHIYVDKRSAGFVYLRFETVEAASAAQRAMHLRWFARRMISAIFMQPQAYEAKFKGED